MKFIRGALAATLLVSLVVIPNAMQATATGLTYDSCSPSQQTTITTAVADALAYADNAVQYFRNNRAGTRYSYWFGAYDSTRWTTVRENYEKIKTELASNNLIFNCADPRCSANVYGFVFPTAPRPFPISLCTVYWTSPATGTDSRAGTLIHFLSQFTSIAGTSSYAYGQTASHSLALTNTSQAILNSDNYEYFAENNPVTADAASAYRTSYGSNYFGNQTVGSSNTTEVFTLTNTGDASLTVTSLAVTGEFSIANDTCRSASIAVNASCTFTVEFRPQTIGSASGIVSITTNAPIATTQVIVTGSGSAAVTTTVTATTTSTTSTTSTSTTVPSVTTNPVVSSTTTVASLTGVMSVRRTTVNAKATSNSSKLTVTIGKISDQLSRKFTVQVRRANKWVSLPGKYSTAKKTANKIIDLPQGQYRVVVNEIVGYQAATSNTIRLAR